MAPHSWWCAHFTDHPFLKGAQKSKNKPPEVYATSHQDKVKLYCTQCLEHEIAWIIKEDEAQFQEGARKLIQSVDQVELLCE